VLTNYTNVSFTAAASPSTCTYTWAVPQNGGLVGTGSSLTLTQGQLGTLYGGQKVWVYATDPYGNTGFDGGWVGIVDSSAMAVATNWITYTNGKDCSLWTIRTTNNPPNLEWNPSCLLYGMTGFTAISQRNQWDVSFSGAPGQMPVTALTARHGYMRGHGAGFPQYVTYGGFNTNFNGSNVYFCASNNTVVTATVTNGFTRLYYTNSVAIYDYTILIFNADLPSTIQPMAVSYSPPPSYSVVFNTEQYGYMSANYPPFGATNSIDLLSADPDAFPPFNVYQTDVLGDSGSPVMVPWTNNVLVFLNGDTTTGPCAQMQTDMDTLSTNINLKPINFHMYQQSVQ
jgi:hypothetical protein